MTLFLVILAGGVLAAPAQAAAYRYWGYFQLTNGAWAFAPTGPAQTVPKDGSVEGWRFAVADENSTRTPRATPTFDSLCASTQVKAGTKRVGLVIDYGRTADATDGATPPALRATCVAVPEKATGSDVLVAAGTTLRLNKGLTCALDGWPATGCGEEVKPVPAAAASPDTTVTIPAPTPSAAANPAGPTSGTSTDDGSSGSSWPVLGGLAAVVLVGGLGFAAWRRGRGTSED
ncbi:MAG: hypothetical protein HHJ11_00220 [Phycicoccus sp.]|nr:hypothetical protein [Phycicoccus sp.]NMM34403.1 hypothetical protein [Phycicoccus sp.]